MMPFAALRMRKPVAAGGGSDPYFANTVLLLGFEGADASTTFTDESSKLRGNASRFGGSQVDTAQFKFGAASGLLGGGADALYYADNNDFEFSNAAFTLEAWVRPNALSGTHAIFAKYAGFGTASWMWNLTATNFNWYVSTDGGNSITLDINVAHGMSTGTWYHLCMEFDGAKYRMYKDGVMVGSFTTVRTLVNNGAEFAIGNTTAFGQGLNGWIDEARVTKGVARYASDGGFTIPAAAYPRS